MMRVKRFLVAIAAAMFAPSVGHAQATMRQCSPVEAVGPACLLARTEIPKMPKGKVYWHLDRFASAKLAKHAGTPTSAVVEAFGSAWLFTIADAKWRSRGGEHVSKIGPLPVEPASGYAAEYLRSIFTPGMTAPLHVHSGPEAFFAVSGDTCLETPDGVLTGRGPGNSLMIKAGPPMLLTAIGKSDRQGFALILHDHDRPPTTLTQEWQPKGYALESFPHPEIIRTHRRCGRVGFVESRSFGNRLQTTLPLPNPGPIRSNQATSKLPDRSQDRRK